MDIPWQHPGIARSTDSHTMVLLGEKLSLEKMPVYGLEVAQRLLGRQFKIQIMPVILRGEDLSFRVICPICKADTVHCGEDLQ